jgi:Zn-dependent peptidase ImmA (M78 family)/transcriptional regulator with XRE-family HTH domain
MAKIPGFNAARLKEARLSRGLTITAFSEKLNVSKQAISYIENGKNTPSIKLLECFSSVLGLPVNYFFIKNTVPDFSTIFYRSLSVTTKKKRVQAKVKFSWFKEIAQYLNQYFDFLPVNVPGIINNKKIEELTIDEIVAAAKSCRRYWNLGDGPISNVTRLLEKQGFIIGNLNIKERDVDAISEWSFDNRPYILMGNLDKSSCRVRFNFAHELGHIILHRHIDRQHFEEYHKKIEDQANLFAGHFLMPKDSFGSELYAPTLNSFISLKTRWKVSLKAMIVHAKRLSLINDEQYRLLLMNYSRKQWGALEPLDDAILVETPEYFSKCFNVLIENNVKTQDELLHDLSFSPQDIEDLVCMDSGFFCDANSGFLPVLRNELSERLDEFKIIQFNPN